VLLALNLGTSVEREGLEHRESDVLENGEVADELAIAAG
jgi:hypothetical protein